MSKNKFVGRVPTTPKGTLTLLAKEQTKQDSSLGTMAEAVGKVKGEPEQPKGQEDSTAPAAEAKPAPAPPKEEPRYMLGKKYAPKTDRNSETWGKITKALNEGPKTMKELAEAVKGHGDFLGYMTRGGHVVPHVPKKEETAATA